MVQVDVEARYVYQPHVDISAQAQLEYRIQYLLHTEPFFFLWTFLGRAGVPMEVMGLMLGEFVDDYTVRVIDVFAMPQSGTGVSVEAVDPVFQTKMLDMLKQTGRCVGRLVFNENDRRVLCGSYFPFVNNHG
jgi:26S proteasome regulatory subunit N11